jgi:hypothetical protein
MGTFPAINNLQINDSVAREQCIADQQSHHCIHHVLIRQGQCSCRQSGFALHVIGGGLLGGGRSEVVFLWRNTNQQLRCLENKLVQRADTIDNNIVT